VSKIPKYQESLVSGDLHLTHNNLKSLEGCPPIIKKTLWANDNKLKDLKNIHKIIHECARIDIVGNPIKGYVLGLLLVKGLKTLIIVDPTHEVVVDQYRWIEIINSYLPNTRGNEALFDCQDELIVAGLTEFAKL